MDMVNISNVPSFALFLYFLKDAIYNTKSHYRIIKFKFIELIYNIIHSLKTQTNSTPGY